MDRDTAIDRAIESLDEMAAELREVRAGKTADIIGLARLRGLVRTDLARAVDQLTSASVQAPT